MRAGGLLLQLCTACQAYSIVFYGDSPGPSCGKTSDTLYTINNPKPAICYPTPTNAAYSYWRLELSAEETSKNPGGIVINGWLDEDCSEYTSPESNIPLTPGTCTSVAEASTRPLGKSYSFLWNGVGQAFSNGAAVQAPAPNAAPVNENSKSAIPTTEPGSTSSVPSFTSSTTSESSSTLTTTLALRTETVQVMPRMKIRL